MPLDTPINWKIFLYPKGTISLIAPTRLSTQVTFRMANPAWESGKGIAENRRFTVSLPFMVSENVVVFEGALKECALKAITPRLEAITRDAQNLSGGDTKFVIEEVTITHVLLGDHHGT